MSGVNDEATPLLHHDSDEFDAAHTPGTKLPPLRQLMDWIDSSKEINYGKNDIFSNVTLVKLNKEGASPLKPFRLNLKKSATCTVVDMDATNGNNKDSPKAPPHQLTGVISSNDVTHQLTGVINSNDVTAEQVETDEAITKAEILWTLNMVLSRYSFQPCNGLRLLFKTMFPDSRIASHFMYSKERYYYLLCKGIAPFFQALLSEELMHSDYYVVMLDENAAASHNLKSEQVDFGITFWNAASNRAETRYLCSLFLPHSRINDLLAAFKDATISLDGSKILQVAMTGPYVNWNYLKAVGDYREENGQPKLINIGNCDIQAIHEAFKLGSKKTGWGLKEILISLHSVIHENPRRRSEFYEITETNLLPLQFNDRCWIENGMVAQRAIEVWESVCEYIESWDSLPYSKQPTSPSAFKMQEIVKDKMIVAQLYFFCYISKALNVLPSIYKASKPMVPFLYDDLYNVVIKITGWFLKSHIVRNSPTIAELCSLDLSSQINYAKLECVNIGFDAENYLRLCLKDDSISEMDIVTFKEECIVFMKDVVRHIMKQSCLMSSVAKNAASLNPNKMSAEMDTCKLDFSKLIEKLTELQRLRASDAGKALIEYNEFMHKVVLPNEKKFSSFSKTDDRLDDFFFSRGWLDSYPNLSSVIKLILCVNHGQTLNSNLSSSSVERDVSRVQTLDESYIVSEKIVLDYLSVKRCLPANFEITDELIASIGDVKKLYEGQLEPSASDCIKPINGCLGDNEETKF